MNKLDEALGLFPSCIKSGELWSPTCQQVLEGAKAELAELRASVEGQSTKIAWLRWGLEEIARCTDMRAGNGDRFTFGIAAAALRNAGIPADAAGIEKPSSPVPSTEGKQP